MRWTIAALAASVVIILTIQPVVAVTTGPPDTDAVQKKRDESATVSVSAQVPNEPRRGDQDVLVRANVSQVGATCQFRGKFRNGNQKRGPDAVVDASGFCSSHMDVPSSTRTVGRAKLIVTVVNSSGDFLGEGAQDFNVKGR